MKNRNEKLLNIQDNILVKLNGFFHSVNNIILIKNICCVFNIMIYSNALLGVHDS